MSSTYTALYRRWRPQLFSDVVGQEHVTRTLQNALSAERVAHAYLFCGLRGTGKTTMAKLLAKSLNCQEGVSAEPCNRCQFCREISAGRSMDVQEIDAASNRGIDEIRELREKVRYSSAQNRYKVYIIDEVHMLTNEAFNALLKTLEEPPPRVVFILATTEIHKLPLTVISRCQRFDFHLLETRQVASRLQEVAADLAFSIEEESLYLLARQAEGSLRDALGFLEQCRAYGGDEIQHRDVLDILGLAAPETIYHLMESVFKEDLLSGLSEIKEIVFRGRDLHRFLKELLLYLRKLILLQAGEDEASVLEDVPALRSYLLEHRDRADHRVILEMLEIIQDLSYSLKGASQPHFLCELAFMRLLRAYRFRRYLDPADLLDRLEELEEKLQPAGISPPGQGASEHRLQEGKRARLPQEVESAGRAERHERAVLSGPSGPGNKPAASSAASLRAEEPGDIARTAPPPEVESDEVFSTPTGESPQERKASGQNTPLPPPLSPAPEGSSGETVPGRPLQPEHPPVSRAPQAADSAASSPSSLAQEQSPAQEQSQTQSPAPAPGSIPAGQTAAQGLDLQKMWLEQVIPALKKHRQTQSTYLLGYLEGARAVPLSWKEGIFTVTLTSPAGKVLHKRLEDPANRKILAALLAELLGTPLELRFVVQEAAGRGNDPGRKVSEGGSSPSPARQSSAISQPVPSSPLPEQREAFGVQKPAGSAAAGSGRPGQGEQKDYYILEIVELFKGQLIQSSGESVDTLDLWSYASSPPARGGSLEDLPPD